eukprot:Transcript_10444.p1 GENE.Transcript_10444~~Transcript_10444.p1  ORF type:complete len:349 (-),score=32.07 Transcript_10444:94-1101(-)
MATPMDTDRTAPPPTDGFAAAADACCGFGTAASSSFAPAGFATAGTAGAAGFQSFQGFQTGRGQQIDLGSHAARLAQATDWLFGGGEEEGGVDDKANMPAARPACPTRRAAEPSFQTAADKVAAIRPGPDPLALPAPNPPARGAAATGRGACQGLSRSSGPAKAGFKPPAQAGARAADGAGTSALAGAPAAGAAASQPLANVTPAAKRGRFNAPRAAVAQAHTTTAAANATPLMRKGALPPTAASATALRAGPEYCACAVKTPFGPRGMSKRSPLSRAEAPWALGSGGPCRAPRAASHRQAIASARAAATTATAASGCPACRRCTPRAARTTAPA